MNPKKIEPVIEQIIKILKDNKIPVLDGLVLFSVIGGRVMDNYNITDDDEYQKLMEEITDHVDLYEQECKKQGFVVKVISDKKLDKSLN